jgi:hypothetical protein
VPVCGSEVWHGARPEAIATAGSRAIGGSNPPLISAPVLTLLTAGRLPWQQRVKEPDVIPDIVRSGPAAGQPAASLRPGSDEPVSPVGTMRRAFSS